MDILQRVVAKYFGYSVVYYMNIADIDDEVNLLLLYFFHLILIFYLKIIKQARQRHLIKKYMDDG